MLAPRRLFIGAPGARGEPAPGDWCLGLVLSFDSIDKSWQLKSERTSRIFPVNEADLPRAHWQLIGDVRENGEVTWQQDASDLVKGTDLEHDKEARAAQLINQISEHEASSSRRKRQQPPAPLALPHKRPVPRQRSAVVSPQAVPPLPLQPQAPPPPQARAQPPPPPQLPPAPLPAARAALPSSQPSLQAASTLTDRRLVMFWHGDPRAYGATVTDHDPSDSSVFLQFDDGDEGWYELDLEAQRARQFLTSSERGPNQRFALVIDDKPTSRKRRALPPPQPPVVQQPAPTQQPKQQPKQRPTQQPKQQPPPQPVPPSPPHPPPAAPAEWRVDGHPWLGERVRRTSWATKRYADGYHDGTLTAWLPEGEDPDGDPALWRMVHDDGDEEDLEEHEVCEALVAKERGLWEQSYADLISQYVAAGVRYLDPTSGAVKVVREGLPEGCPSARAYFATRDLYVGNMYGHVGTIYLLGSSHGRHKTTSCRDPFVVVLPKQQTPRPYIRCTGWTQCTHVKDSGWPDQHPSSASILKRGAVSGGMVRTQAAMFAALRWPSDYEFLEAKESDCNWDKCTPTSF
jgi:hypothetical protein